jgi:potassium efflux system protein
MEVILPELEQRRFVPDERAALETLYGEIARLKKERNGARGEQARLLDELISRLGQEYQLRTELSQVRAQIIAELEHHERLISQLMQDPHHAALRLEPRSSYDFDVLIEQGRRILSCRVRLAEIEKLRQSSEEDLIKRKRGLSFAQDELKEFEKIRAAGTEKQGGASRSKLQTQLLKSQEQVLQLRHVLAQERVREAEVKLAFLDSELLNVRGQFAILQDEYASIKRLVKIDDTYVTHAQKKLEERRHESVTKRDELNEKMRVLLPYRDALKKRLRDMLEQMGLSDADVQSYIEWGKEPVTEREWRTICLVGVRAADLALAETEREYLEAQIEYEKMMFKREEVDFEIVKSWRNMSSRSLRLTSDQLLEQEARRYAMLKAEIQADINALSDKRDASIETIRRLNGYLERITQAKGSFKEFIKREQTSPPSESDEEENKTCLTRLKEAEEAVRRRIDWTARLIELYSTGSGTADRIQQEIDSVVQELNTRNFWRRSTKSIEWRELHHVRPDLIRFFYDTVTIIRQRLTPSAMLESMQETVEQWRTSPVSLFVLLLSSLLLLVIYFLLRFSLPEFGRFITSGVGGIRLFALMRLSVASFLEFICYNFVVVYAWTALIVLIRVGLIRNVLFISVFYLLSIPFLLWLFIRFFAFYKRLNERRNYLFISRFYESRFFLVVPTATYIVVVLAGLREAFLLGGYHASPVPSVLLALAFLVVQISLVLLLGREQVLSFIPSSTPLWEWVKEQCSRYYYGVWLAVMAVIIMSNPYVGYGRQVLYVTSRIILTGLMVPLMLWVHNRIKLISSDLFFYYITGDVIKERFAGSKTWYGIFLSVTFIGLGLLTLLVLAHLWGARLGLHDVWYGLNLEIYSPGVDPATARRISVSIVSLFQVILFVLGGMGVYLLARFVLKQVFGFLFIGSGVQHAVLSLTRYIFMIIAFLMGLHYVGLHSTVWTMTVAIGGLFFLVKEPITDFFCYLIILIQRPVKIGDLIMLDQEATGVVRQITPRSVIVRRRNSVTIIIPNSHIITRSVVNWNYSRSYIAFNDMHITVPYSADPAFIRQLFLKVLHESPNVLKSPAPIVWLHDFVDNGYQFLVRGYITADKVLEQWEISSEVRLEIVRRLTEHGLRIAAPTRRICITQDEEGNKHLGQEDKIID